MVVRILTGMDAVTAASFILLQDHVFCKLDKRLQKLTGLYLTLRSIENSFAIGMYDDQGNLQGLSWGDFDGIEYVNHVAFMRHANATAYSPLVEKELLKQFPTLRRIVGNIPETNRAALRFARQCGYTEQSCILHVSFINEYGNEIPCKRMVKNIEA